MTAQADGCEAMAGMTRTLAEGMTVPHLFQDSSAKLDASLQVIERGA
jgi:hypothetical protein